MALGKMVNHRRHTLQGNAVHSEGSSQLRGNLHTATDKGLAKHVLEGFIKVWTVA